MRVRRRLAVAVVTAGVAAAAACGGSARTRPPSTAAILQVDCPVADAMLWIDDQAVGEVGEITRGVLVRPGAHRIEVRHDRYHTRYILMTLQRGQAHTVHVTMVEQLD